MFHSQTGLTRPLGAAFICAALLLFSVGVTGLYSRAEAQSASRLEGQVLDGTASAPAGATSRLDVTLFQMGPTGPVTKTVQTDDQGHFTFANLKLDPNSPYFASVDYGGIHYFSDVQTPGIESSIPITLTIYETQTVPANFQIDRAHFILDINQNALSGVELLQIEDPTDRAFVLPLPLPQNLSGLQFNDPRDQFRAIEGSDGSVAFPILPTTDQILVGVQVNTAPGEYTLKVNTPVKIGRLNVLISQTGGAQVSSPMLTAGPVFTSQSGNGYWQLNGDNISAGTTVPVLVTNLPGGDNSTLVRGLVLGVGGLGALILLSVPFLRSRRTLSSLSPARTSASNRDREEGGEKEAIGERRLARLKAIAELDDAFEAGVIPEDEYRTERAALKAELMNDSNLQA